MLFPTKTVQQAAALPFVPTARGFDVLLITSRGGKRWLLPKGWPRGQQSLAETAVRETFEEAGVDGAPHRMPIGEFTYRKSMRQGYSLDCHVFVFPLLVTGHHDDWPERGQRERRWVDLTKASGLVGDPHLADLLARLARNDCNALRAVFQDMEPDVSHSSEKWQVAC